MCSEQEYEEDMGYDQSELEIYLLLETAMKNFIVFISNGDKWEIIETIYSVICESESEAKKLALEKWKEDYCEEKKLTVTNVIEIADVTNTEPSIKLLVDGMSE